MTTNESYQTKLQNFIKMIDNRIHAVFNRNFFGLYEGTIESINDIQATLNISVPALDNILIENCRVCAPGISSSAHIMPRFEVGANVLIVFTSFKFSNPVVIGQISPINTIHTALGQDIITIVNGIGSININSNGDINITGNAITLNGNTITANGEDLTSDDIGAL